MGSPGGTGSGDGGGGLFGAASDMPPTKAAASDAAATKVIVKTAFGTNFIGRKSKEKIYLAKFFGK
ncbi:hypothetical protein [Flavobacterium sp.]|uniref:hypothetical protein n=1 Tax=Flavobacterium sp. TaxID=239 RepID=UPI0025C052A5|nr:hypothetical protein [Flavobacterium sp.]